MEWNEILGWPKSVFGFFHIILGKKPNKPFWPTQYNKIEQQTVSIVHYTQNRLSILCEGY